MMRLLLKGLGLFVLIACLVWLGVLWRWQVTRHDMLIEDVVLYLALLPLGLFVFVLLARWAWRGAVARADLREAHARAVTQPVAEPLPPADAARHATCQVLAATLHCAAATNARELLQAVEEGKPRPSLDRHLRRADGLPTITARVAAADEAGVADALATALERLCLRRPEFLGRDPGDRLQRALGLLRPVLADALAALSPWRVALGGQVGESADTGSVPGFAAADTRSQVAAHATRRAPGPPQPPAVRVLVAWPEGTDEFGRELARQWLADTLRSQGEGTVAPERWRVHAQAVGAGPELLLEADRLLHDQRRLGCGDLLLVAACHSDLDAPTVLRLDDAGALFGTATPRGRLPGEAAVALVLADAGWPTDPLADRPPPHLHRPGVGQRGKSIDAPGRISSDLAVELLQHALAAARLDAAQALALATDADQHTPRGPELFGATLAELPHLDATEDLRLAGPLCGHLGPCGALVSVAMAAQHAADTGQPCLALSVADTVWRAAAVARPAPPAAAEAAPPHQPDRRMNRFWTILFDARVLAVIGLAALAAFLSLGAEAMRIAAIWATVALAGALLLWAVVWAGQRWWAWRRARAFEGAIDEQAGLATQAAPAARQREVAVLRQRLHEAVSTIRGSKLGQLTGNAALYELPWYMVIGNPAAGKSTAIVKSGLHFPFTDNTGNIIQGIGGTRNCDWFFTTEGILLDTAGRYAVQEEDRQEWLGFLGLLKRHRPKAPINGILIAASAAELAAGRPEDAIELAKSLRQRVQELTEQLEVFAPVYLVFTKADLIAGFADFFEDSDRGERERVWGATLPYEAGDQPARADLLAQFDARFDELCDGLRDMSVARMTLQRGQALPPGVLAFPLEFTALKPALRAFVATLFEDNPYQFRPVFRGFYFTSAMQEGRSTSRAGERVAQQFGLRGSAGEQTTGMVMAEHGFFLRELFSKVIFADKELVRQYASRAKQRLRLGALLGSVATLAIVLGALSWSYLGNRQLVASITADLDQVVKLQAERTDLASRLEALGTLQDRIEELRRHRDHPPLGLSLGLYQGEAVERHLMQEYFAGMKQVMLQPVAQSIEAYLGEVNANPGRLKPMGRPPESGAASAENAPRRPTQGGGRFVDASPEDSSDAYNALKTYLMLADAARLEPNHLTDQLTRFWRGWLDDNRGAMPREQMIRAAERVITFSAANVADPAFPTVGNNLALVDAMREHLREVARGMRGVERVYADIKTRAATRFPPVTVAGLQSEADKDVVAGSYAVPGPFTREAWDGYIEDAFKQAAGSDLQSTDWVLKTSARDDLTLEGSPEQIRKQLTELYKTEYVREWQRFMQGVSVHDFDSFEQAVARMNRLGDPQQSPIRKLMNTLFDQTSWDNPSLLNERLAVAQRGFIDWFKQTILRQAPAKVELNVKVDAATQQIPLGPIGREFAPLARLMMSRDNQAATPMAEYLQALSKLRTRFNQIKNQGDTGPGTRALIAQTLEGGQSELTEALRFVDERMLVGMTDTARTALRPLLVRPLVQALAVAVPPAETELNRIWAAQVYEPFQRTLAGKYPFDANARVEAAPGDVAKVFGPEGAIAKFTAESLGPLVVRRGDLLEPRQWAEIGIRLRPEFAADFGGWIAPVESAMAAGAAAAGGSVGISGAAVAPAPDQTVFQVLPQGAPGVSEYTLVIDGQALRYRNTAAEWANMVWPNPAGVAGARLVAVTNEGRSVEVVNEPGALGLTRLFELAQVKKLGDGVNEMSWSQGNVRVAVHLRVLRSPGEAPKPAAVTGTAPPDGGGAPGVGQLRLRGVRLPQLVAGATGPSAQLGMAEPPVAGTAPVAAAVGVRP